MSSVEVEEIVREELADELAPAKPERGLSPKPVLNADGSVRHPGLDNLAMGTTFEDLVRRFSTLSHARQEQKDSIDHAELPSGKRYESV